MNLLMTAAAMGIAAQQLGTLSLGAIKALDPAPCAPGIIVQGGIEAIGATQDDPSSPGALGRPGDDNDSKAFGGQSTNLANGSTAFGGQSTNLANQGGLKPIVVQGGLKPIVVQGGLKPIVVQGGSEAIVGEKGSKSPESASTGIVGEDGIIGEEGRCVTPASK